MINQAFDKISINSYAEEKEVIEREIYRLKIIVLGAANVGKSSLLYQYTKQRNPQFQPPTVGTDFVTKIIQMKGIQCHLQIWDTADYLSPSIPTSLFNKAIGFIIFYDITNRKSFDPILMIMNDLVNKGDMNKQIFLVGNKADREMYDEREISRKEVENFAKNRRIKTKEISSKNHNQVQELFNDLIDGILQKIDSNIIKKESVQYDGNNQRIILGGEGFQKRYNRCC